MYQNNNTLMEELEELRNQNAELRDELEVKNVELDKEKEKNIELEAKLLIEHTDNIYNKEEASEEMIPRDKIKAKIEEIQTQLSGMTIYLGNRTAGKTKGTIEQLLKEAEIKVLQELLEE